MNIDDDTRSPFRKLCDLSARRLATQFPQYHNALLGGVFWWECEVFAMDALLHKNLGGFWFPRLNIEDQQQIIGGVEELLLEELPPGIWDFYHKKLEAGPRHGYPP